MTEEWWKKSFVVVFKIESLYLVLAVLELCRCSADQVDLKITDIPLPLPPKGWDKKSFALHMVINSFTCGVLSCEQIPTLRISSKAVTGVLFCLLHL